MVERAPGAPSRRRGPFIVVAALLVAACVLGITVAFFVVRRDVAPPQLRRRATAWDGITRGIGADGSVSATVALDAFALLFGALPSSRNAPQPDASVPFCGTLVVRWVRASWASISPNDRARIEAVLSSRASAAVEPRWGAPIAYAQARDSASLRALVASLQQRIETLVGVRLRKRVVLDVLATDGLRDDAPAWWSAGAPETPQRAWAETAFVPTAARPRDTPDCRIRVGQRVFRVDERTRAAALTHELFHCFQLDAFEGTTGQWLDLRARASWMIEGAAAWVGEAIAGAPTAAASEQWWWAYFSASPRGRWALGPTSFEAIGFYAHLDERGAPPWQHLLPIVNLEPAAAFARLTSGRPEVLSTWPSSTRLRTSWGSAWDQRGSVVRRDGGPRDPVPRSTLANGAPPLRIETEARTTTVVELALSRDGDVVVIDATGYGRARFAADAARDVEWSVRRTARPDDAVDPMRRFVCRSERPCACPDGRAVGTPSVGVPREAPLVVAIAGEATRSSHADVRLVSIADACRLLPPIATPHDPCLVGTWTLDLEHARTQIAATTPPGQTLRGVSGSYTMSFDAAGTSSARLSRYGVTMGRGGIESTSEIDGTSTSVWMTTIDVHAGRGPSRGVLRLTGGHSELTASAVVRVLGRAMRTPVPLPAGQGGAASGADWSSHYECSAAALTLDHDPPAIDQRFTR